MVLSCREEISPESTDGAIVFSVEEGGDFVTRSQVAESELSLQLGGQELLLSLSEEKNVTSVGAVTRGIPFDNDDNKVNALDITALIENGAKGDLYFNENVTINDAGKGLSGHFWPTESLSFFAYACSKNNVTVTPSFMREENVCKGTFDYTLPAPSVSAVKKDASNQPDLVFAITPDQPKGDVVPLRLHHALSALEFRVGKMPEGTILKGITISGVYSSGTCTMTATGDKDISFVWTYENGQASNGSYTEQMEQTAASGDQIGGEEALFMLLPQTLTSDTKLTLTFSVGGSESQLEADLKDIITKWEADRRYIFTISIPKEVEVEVEDEVTGVVKKNVVVTNTGSGSGYVRAAIIGYWTDLAGNVVAPWKEDDGVFVWGDGWDTYWKKGSDGFYYHLSPVPAKENTHPLFQSYTLKTSTAIGSSHAFRTLELTIAVQIIMEKDKSLWPEISTL